MKILFRLFFVLFPAIFFGQVVSGKLFDSETNKALEFASVSIIANGFTVFTNAEGHFAFENFKADDQIQISYIGYESKIINSADFKVGSANIFYLSPVLQELQEVVLVREVPEYSGTKEIKSTNHDYQNFSFQFGTENCRFIANPYNQAGKIKSVTLDLTKVKDGAKPCKLCKVDYIPSYSLKFYKYDKKQGKPGREIYAKSIIIHPENKTYKLNIDLDSLQIYLPKDGICIGIETINTKYGIPKKVFAITAPSIKFVENRKISPVTSWVRHRGEEWSFRPNTSRDRNGKFLNEIWIDLQVKLEKK